MPQIKTVLGGYIRLFISFSLSGSRSFTTLKTPKLTTFIHIEDQTFFRNPKMCHEILHTYTCDHTRGQTIYCLCRGPQLQRCWRTQNTQCSFCKEESERRHEVKKNDYKDTWMRILNPKYPLYLSKSQTDFLRLAQDVQKCH